MPNNVSNAPEQDENKGTNTNPVAKEPSYEEVMAALESGDGAALDRLMAVNESDDDSDQDTDEASDGENGNGNEPPVEKDQGSQEDDTRNEPVEAANAASNAQPQQNNQPDPNEELRRELHRVKSELGRVGAMQRRMQQLEEELRATRARASANEPANGGNSNQPKEPQIPEKVRTRIEQLRAVDPDLADTLTEMYSSVTESDHATREDVMRAMEEQRHQEEADRFYAEQKQLLSQYVPQHEQVFASPHWAEWKDQLLPGQRAMAESGYAMEVAQAIQAFAHWYKSNYGNPQQSPASSQGGDPNAADPNAETGNNRNSVDEQRKRKLEASTGVRNTPAKPTEVFDEQAYFTETYNRLLKDQGLK